MNCSSINKTRDTELLKYFVIRRYTSQSAHGSGYFFSWFSFHWQWWKSGATPAKAVELPGIRWEQNEEFFVTAVRKIYHSDGLFFYGLWHSLKEGKIVVAYEQLIFFFQCWTKVEPSLATALMQKNNWKNMKRLYWMGRSFAKIFSL